MPLGSKKLHCFGLDISDSSVKIMLLQQRGKIIRPLAFNAEIFPRGIVTKDEIREPGKLSTIIRRAIDHAKPRGFNNAYVVASLPESKSFIRLFDLPPMKETELPAAVKWEAEQHIPLSIDQVEMDWQALNPRRSPDAASGLRAGKLPFFNRETEAREHGWKIFMTASPKDVVNPVVAVLKMSKLQPVALESESIAIARSCISPELQKQTVLLVDIGTNRTGLTIVNNNVLNFTSSISLAGLTISQKIMDQAGLDFSAAEKAKITHGLSGEKQAPAVKSAIETALQEIITEIKNTIGYYQEHSALPDKQVDLILLSGGTARLPGLVDWFTRNIELPTRLANPWVNIYPRGSRELPPISSADSLSFTAVIGLALRGLNFTI